MYQHSHKKPIGCEAMAQALSNTLYGKRFFPFYTFNILAGLDADGTGAVYSYDAVGSYERTGYAAQGTGMLAPHRSYWATISAICNCNMLNVCCWRSHFVQLPTCTMLPVCMGTRNCACTYTYRPCLSVATL